ncbi:MAG TPA: bifunctional oligoribonuclease/PAP phosphatase NrnA [Vicinamibacterales bacterium]|nr:bifunctional oligoribonuclease/PAP phosphatase NrnA [Vicinamibacterales bacterium]
MPETAAQTTTPDPEHRAAIERIRDAVLSRQRFVISSHARPDGDSIGSQLAMAYALRALGKDVVIVNCDPAPGPLMAFPGVPSIRVADRVEGEFDAAIVLECSELARTGVEGLDRYFLINIDHHPGNAAFGAVNWFNGRAAACAEMVFDVIEALRVPLSVEIATHVYVGILTDTGSFHYSNITPRTFDICRRLVEAGVDPPKVARSIFDSNSLGRLKLFGAVLSSIELEDEGRLAIVRVDREMAARAGGTYEDTEGLINLPLTVRDIQAVVFFKELGDREYRVSMRSKGEIDVCSVAKRYGGGGHKNASGCTVIGSYAEVRARLTRDLVDAIERGLAAERALSASPAE